MRSMRWIRVSTLGSDVGEELHGRVSLRWHGEVTPERARALGYLPEDECKIALARKILELYRKPKGLGEYGDFLLLCREASRLFGWEYRSVTYDNRFEPNAKSLARKFYDQAPAGALKVFFGSSISAGPGVSAGSTWTAAYIVLPPEVLEAAKSTGGEQA